MHQEGVLHVNVFNSLRAVLSKETLTKVVFILHSVEYAAFDQVWILHTE